MDDPDQTDGLMMSDEVVREAQECSRALEVFSRSMSDAAVYLDHLKSQLKRRRQRRVAVKFVAHRLGRN